MSSQNSKDDEIPRRIRLDKLTPAEKAIFDAVDVVEGMGAHPLLTEIIAICDFIDAATTRKTEFKDRKEGESDLREMLVTRFPGSEKTVDVALSVVGNKIKYKNALYERRSHGE